MRILQTIAPAEFGGLEEVVIRLARGLARRGHHTTVAAFFTGEARPHPFVDKIGREGVEVVARFVPPRAYLRERSYVRTVCERIAPEICHTHGYRPDVLHPGPVRRMGIPCITTLHGFTGGGIRNRFYEWLQLRSVRSLEGVVAVSSPIATRLRTEGVSPDRVHVIPNAWAPRDRPLTWLQARRTLGVAEEGFHIGWVGRLSHEKGPDTFLEALELLPGLGLQVSVLGDGRLRGTLASRLGRLARHRVTFHGAVTNAAGLFPGFDLLVLSSRSEGTPIVLFEAMEAGVPIVATRVGGVPDVLDENTAILVSSDDPAALADGIRSVREDPERARLRARRAKARLRRSFALEPWIQRHENLYRQLVQRSSSTDRGSR